MRSVPDPTPPVHHLPSPPPSADITAPSFPRIHPPLLPAPRRPGHPPCALPDPRDMISVRPPQHHHSPPRFSVSSASSSSEHCPSPPVPTAGIRRKVAESLQLFKESATTLAKRRLTTSHPNDGVAEARYEFVKRADWPDPETAALRRERSSTALENVRTRESIDSQTKRDPDFLPPRPLPFDLPFSDPSHWRKDVSRQDPVIRGRRKRRPSDRSTLDPQDDSSLITVPQSPCIRPCSRAYPPSPSPSRSPTDRIPPLALYNSPMDVVSMTDESHLPALNGTYLANLNRSHSRSPTPTYISPHPHTIALPPAPPSPSRSFSPWSTDDESAWETSSMTSDISTTSGTSDHPLSLSQIADESIGPLDEAEKIRASPRSEDDPSCHGSNLWNADSLNMVYGDSEESLPHIPLRPFRNQVGGHSAIYKFTKRAVCKVSILYVR